MPAGLTVMCLPVSGPQPSVCGSPVVLNHVFPLGAGLPGIPL
jgi:hypothetical protein